MQPVKGVEKHATGESRENQLNSTRKHATCNLWKAWEKGTKSSNALREFYQ